MFGMFKKLKGAGAEIANKSIKAENKDLMEACVGAVALMAYADGELEDSEVKAINDLLSTTKQLEPFGNQVNVEFDRLCKRFESGYRMGRLEVMKEIADVKGNKEEAEIVLVLAIEIAFADGELEPEEEKELETIAGKLGLRLTDYI